MIVALTFVLNLVAADTSPAPSGWASYYANSFSGRRTASGERYRPDELTAAHRSLPFGTLLLVTRFDTGDSVVVRVNDRGPFSRRRIVDLSRAAAMKLDMLHAGTCRVALEIFVPSVPPETVPEIAPLTPQADTNEIFPPHADDSPALAVAYPR